MDRLAAMQVFVRVAELNSFAAVAQQLGLARSMVTRQVAALENHLGTKLLVRSTRRLSLTSAGQAYLEKCRVILNLVETAETDIAEDRQTPRGHIRMSLPLAFGLKRLAPLLLDFSSRYPAVSLDMDYSERKAKLIEEGIDLSIRITRQLAPGDVARRLGSSQLKVVAAPEYLARHGHPGHPAELIHHQCLAYTGNTQQAWEFLIDGQLRTFPIRARLHANNGEFLTRAAAQGLGIACQPGFIVEDGLADGSLQEILSDYPQPELGIYALLPSNRQVPHRVRVLMEFLAEGLGPTGEDDSHPLAS